VEQAFEESVAAAGGRIDTVFANAGRAARELPHRYLARQWRDVMATNLDGAFLTLRAAARHMIDHGGGSLVAVSSISAITALAVTKRMHVKDRAIGLGPSAAVSLARYEFG